MYIILIIIIILYFVYNGCKKKRITENLIGKIKKLDNLTEKKRIQTGKIKKILQQIRQKNQEQQMIDHNFIFKDRTVKLMEENNGFNDTSLSFIDLSSV